MSAVPTTLLHPNRRLLLAAAGGALLAPAGARAQQPQARRGGTLVVGQAAHPPSLDDHVTNAVSAKHATFHIYETLMTRGEQGQVIPGLAAGVEASADGLTYRFPLRPGVKFHNGKALTSADVVASFARYRRVALRRDLLNPVEAIEAPDPLTVLIRLARRQPLFLEDLSQLIVPMSVYPAEDSEAAPHRNSRVGTGPFRFVEWTADRQIVLERFAEYAVNEAAPGVDGYGGRKEPLVDRVVFRFIPEPSAMVAAIERGEIQVAETVPNRSGPTLQRNSALTVHRVLPSQQHMVYVNPVKPPFDKLDIRRAVQVALDIEQIMDVAHDGNFLLNPGLMWIGRPSYTDAGKEFYNVNDPARARALLRQGGYAGEPIVMTTSSDYRWMVDGATVMADQLRAIGMRVEMVVSDWPAHTRIRGNREAYHFSHSGKFFNQWIDSPATYLQEWAGDRPAQFVPDPELTALVGRMRAEVTPEARRAAFAQAQHRFFEQVHALTLGDRGETQVTRANLVGFKPSVTLRLWGVGFAEGR